MLTRPARMERAKQANSPRPLEELVKEAADLAAALDQDATLNDQRRDYLSRHVTAMQTSLRLLLGEPLPLAEEVTLLYDITPAWVDEREFEEAHRRLDDLLPPGDSLFERLSPRKQSVEFRTYWLRRCCPRSPNACATRRTAGFPCPTMNPSRCIP